jgi:DNA-directed RNA polymerase subunit omega
MSQTPIEDLMEHVDSKYRLVIVAAKRAKQLNRGAAPLLSTRSVKPTYQALQEIATGKLGYEIEPLAGDTVPELVEAGVKPTWYRALGAEEVVPEEIAAVEPHEEFEEEEEAVVAPVAGAAAEDLLMNEFEEENLEEIGEIDITEKGDADE